MYKRKRLAFLCLGMVFAFLVNSVPGYAAEGIDSLPVAGTVSIDNSVPADPSSISEAAFDTDLPDSRSSAPESESTSVPADISNETKPDDVIDPASSTSRVEAETVTEPIEGSETGTDSETLLPAEIELKKIAPVDESPSETAARSADVGDIPIDEQHFPGKVFREWLLGKREGDPANPNVFGSDDGVLTESERAAVKELRFHYSTQSGPLPPAEGLDLTGIEYFPNLTMLSVQNVEITKDLDVSQNTKLKTLSLALTGIKGTVDVSSLPDLEVLILSRNEITSLDVSHNPKLKNLGVSMLEKDGLTGKLTELDLSNNPALTYIDIDGNKLSSLDLSNNKELTTIDVDNNELQALDVSMLPKLEYLYAESNALRKIDVTKNPALIRLYVSGNAGITSMDMSNNPNLKELGVQQTTLFFLDVKNNPNLEILHVGNNPLLGFEIPDGGGSLPILYYNFLRAITVKATPEGTFDLGQLVPELDSSRISDLKGADRIEGTTLYGLKDGVDVTYYYRIGTMADGRKPNMLARIHIVQDPLPVGEAELNVHVLNSTATPEMLKQMNPILIAADGTQYQPNEIANGFRARFQDIPEGDYTVKFTYPSGYRFKAGTTVSNYPYLDTGSTVHVTAGNVMNNFYTRLSGAYSIFYDVNGGDANTSTTQTDLIPGQYSLNNAQKPTHSDQAGQAVAFIGWTSQKDLTVYSKSSSGLDLSRLLNSVQVIDKDVTVYALWGLDENGNGVADVLEDKALLVFRVVNGTWADGSHGDKTVVVLLEDGKGTLSNADVPTGMKPNQNYTNGHWDQTPDTTVGSISGNHAYTYLYDTAASVPSTPQNPSPSKPAAVSASTPQTGDPFNIVLLLGLLLASCTGLLLTIVIRLRKNKYN